MKYRLTLILILLFTLCVFGQEEKLEVHGAIQIGNSEDPTPDPGTIRWTGIDFEGWNGFYWLSLTGRFASVVDIDGNSYNTVRIGNQVWMKDNLKTTHYNDGTPIHLEVNQNAWENLTTPAYCWYQNDPVTYADTYGALYNFYVGADSNSRNVCPVGWHVPSVSEWDVLTDFLINAGYGYEGSGSDIAKSMATTSGWSVSPTPGQVGNDQVTNNKSGFSGVPGGLRNNIGFININNRALWYSSSDSGAGASTRSLNYNSAIVGSSFNTVRFVGLSIRCVKD